MQDPRTSVVGSNRRGLTVIELLVGITIVSVLVAIALPAIQNSREAARRLECSNHLRQIGQALHQYVASYSVFPANHYGPATVDGVTARIDDLSAHARLLPFLGYSAVFDKIGSDVDMRIPEQVAASIESDVPIMRCPSDSLSGLLRGNFCFSIGAVPIPHPGLKRSGAFPARTTLRPSDFTDGLSNTAGVAEKLVGSEDQADVLRDAVLVSTSVSAEVSASAMYWIETCKGISSASNWNADRGSPWFVGSRMIYNHVTPPNSPVIDCGESGTIPMFGIHAARSFHSGSVNVMKMDGSVTRVADTIDLDVWWSLGSRASGE